MRRRFEELTTADLSAAGSALAGWAAVLPVAAVEQHGPHLPLGTDAIIADAMVAAVIERLPEAAQVTFLPTLRVGCSGEHASFPGTLDLGGDLGAQTLLALGRGLGASGFRRLVIVSAHGGNTPAMETAALALRRACGMLVATCGWMRFGVPAGLLPEAEVASGIHGGAVETSLMLHLRPDLVRVEAVAAFASLQTVLEEEGRRLRAHGRFGFGWLAEDLNPAGVVGDASLATAAIGAAVIGHQADGFIELLADVLAFDLARLGT